MSSSRYEYYDDLSCDSSDNSDNSDSEEEDMNNGLPPNSQRLDHPHKLASNDDSHHQSIIVHVDVDCFYCQCEVVDGRISGDQPFAIGQKHIIVTSNYVARTFGVQKLQLREAAYAACPQLIILEGSDLERYRIHGRKIYECFRSACKQIHPRLSVAKGSMDEMMADFTPALLEKEEGKSQRSMQTNANALSHYKDDDDDDSFFIYGESGTGQATLTEDQTGSSTRVVETFRTTMHPPNAAQQRCTEDLQRVGDWALRIRRAIMEETGFTTTVGVSVNPMLAKVAVGLRKPATVNLLYPWRSASLVASMPLRLVPGVGRTTVKALNACLAQEDGPKEFFTCRNQLLSALRTVVQFQQSSEEHLDIILSKCQGNDPTRIKDDGGGLAKSISVENSFRRGTVRTLTKLRDEMGDFYRRLHRLLRERQAVPHTIRLTLRSVDENLKGQKRRPFVTRSKQANFRGEMLQRAKNAAEEQALLKKAAMALLQAFGLSESGIDITRCCIAVTNFKDDLPPRSQSSIISQLVSPESNGSRQPPSQQNKMVPMSTPSPKAPPNLFAQTKRQPQSVPPKSRKDSVSSTQKRRRIDQYFTPLSK